MSVKPYRAKVILYNNRLREALDEEFPEAKSTREMAYRMGMSEQTLYALLTMRIYPLHKKFKVWTDTAMKISTELNKSPEWLFDPELYGKGPLSSTRVIDADRSLGGASPEDLLLDSEARKRLPEAVEEAISRLRPREARLLGDRFGLDGKEPRTLRDVCGDFDVCSGRLQQIEAKAFRKLRHPRNSNKLREFME